MSEVCPYAEVKVNMDKLMSIADDDQISKVNEYADTIENFFDTPERKEDATILQEFAKEEPRKSWESYKDDFGEIDLENVEDAIEPVEEEVDDAVEAVEEEDVVSEDAEIEPVEEEVEVVEDAIEPVDEDVVSEDA